MTRWPVLLAVVLAVVVGCTPGPRLPPTPNPVDIPARCPDRTAPYTGSDSEAPTPESAVGGIVLQTVIWCRFLRNPYITPFRVQERILVADATVRAALTVPEGPDLGPNVACPLVGYLPAYLIGVRPDGRAFRLREPRDACGTPLPETMAAISAHPFMLGDTITVER